MARRRKWLQSAIKRPGAFTRKARAAGMSVQAYARKVVAPGSRADTQTKRQAYIALRAKRGWKGPVVRRRAR